MYIGKLASLTGVTQKAIRHYEKLGLLPTPERKGKYRIYHPIDVQLLLMIKRAQSVGFTLAEITELAQIKAQQRRFPLDIAQQLFREKHAYLKQQQIKLNLMTQDLIALETELIQMYQDDIDH